MSSPQTPSDLGTWRTASPCRRLTGYPRRNTGKSCRLSSKKTVLYKKIPKNLETLAHLKDREANAGHNDRHDRHDDVNDPLVRRIGALKTKTFIVTTIVGPKSFSFAT